MTLVQRKMTPKLLAANRANAQKSTGPRTELGIRTTSMNAIKHLVFAQAMKANMREMGENPEEYEALCQALNRAFGPQDEFEQMLVEEMAQIHWRRQRLIRAESGLAASQRQRLEIDRALKGRGLSAYQRALLFQGVTNSGFAGMIDCIEKCDRMLETLRAIHEGDWVGGIGPDLTDLFEIAYGKIEAASGGHLKSDYESYRSNAKNAPRDLALKLQKDFLAKVDEEIAKYEKLKALLMARDVDTTPALMDAQLMPETERLDAFTRYDAGLEKQFENKVKLLVAWRSAKLAAALPAGSGEGDPLPAVTVENGRGDS